MQNRNRASNFILIVFFCFQWNIPGFCEDSVAAATELCSQSKFSLAAEILNRLIIKNPDDPVLRINRGAVLSKLGKQNDALADEDLAIVILKKRAISQENREYLSMSYTNRAGIFEEQHKLILAEQSLNQALKFESLGGSVHEQLGKVFGKKGKHVDAINEFKIARQVCYQHGGRPKDLERLDKLIDEQNKQSSR